MFFYFCPIVAMRPIVKPFLFFSFFIICLSCTTNRADRPPVSSPDTAVKGDDSELRRFYDALRDDSLVLAHGDAKGRIESHLRVATFYYNMDSSVQALRYFKDVASIADSLSDKEYLGMAYNNLALVFGDRSDYDSALIYYQKSRALFEEMGQAIRVAQGLINEGIIYKNMGRHDTAFARTLAGARLLEGQDAAFELGSAYTNLGNILESIGEPEEAIRYFKKAMGIWEALNDLTGIAGAWNNMGNVHKRTGNYKKALHHYQKALAAKNKAGSKKKALILGNIAQSHIGLHKLDSAEHYLQQAADEQSQNNDIEGYMTTVYRLAQIHLARNDLGKAERSALENLEIAKPSFFKQRLDNILLLEEIYRIKKDYERAALYAHKAMDLKDSVFIAASASSVPLMHANFQMKEQREELDKAKELDLLRSVKLKTQQMSLWISGCGILVLLALVYVLYRSNRFRKRSKEHTELLMTDLNHRVKNNMQIMTGILFLQKQKAANDPERELLDAVSNRLQFMGTLHGLLYQKNYTGQVNLRHFFKKLCHSIDNFFGGPAYKPALSTDIDDIECPIDTAIPLGLIVNEMLTNIYKHGDCPAGVSPMIYVRLSRSGARYRLQLEDNNLEWDPAKGKQDGLGRPLIQTLVQQLEGEWRHGREDGRNVQTIIFVIK